MLHCAAAESPVAPVFRIVPVNIYDTSYKQRATATKKNFDSGQIHSENTMYKVRQMKFGKRTGNRKENYL